MAARPAKFVIRRPDQLEIMASPFRQRIVAAFEFLGPSPVRDIADHLGREPEALYYHLRKLQAVGLVRETGKARNGRRSEAIYDIAARNIGVDTETRSPKFLEKAGRMASALLRVTERAYLAALHHPSSVRGPGPRHNLSIHRHHVRLSRRDLAELNRRMANLEAFLVDRNNPDEPQAYNFTIALSPEVGGDDDG